MPVLLTDGPLGLEARHQWNGGVILGDNQGALPRFYLDRISGLHSLPEIEENVWQNVGRIGEVPFSVETKGRTLVYEGRVQGRTLQEMRAQGSALRAAFQNRRVQGTMVITPHPTYGAGAWQYTARVMQLDIDEEQTYAPTSQPTAFQRNFILGLRLGDPRMVATDVTTEPVMTDPAAASNAQLTLTNLGNAPADPYFDMYGPILGDVAVVRVGPGPTKYLWFRSVDVADGHTFRVDFRTQTAKDITADQDLTGLLDLTSSDWWDEGEEGLFALGDTIVSMDGSPAHTPTWRVAYRHSAY